jgi:hypothetical protein
MFLPAHFAHSLGISRHTVSIVAQLRMRVGAGGPRAGWEPTKTQQGTVSKSLRRDVDGTLNLSI